MYRIPVRLSGKIRKIIFPTTRKFGIILGSGTLLRFWRMEFGPRLSLEMAQLKVNMECKKADWRKVIDLFAGCGGLSAGLTSGVYTPVTCF